jgi:hypothetical protein
MEIHLVESLNHFVKIKENVWESGSWPLDELEAKKLVGGKIYFHKKRQEPSFYGGTILGYRVNQEGACPGGIVFILAHCLSCRNVRTEKTGWIRDMKISALESQPSRLSEGREMDKDGEIIKMNESKGEMRCQKVK